jgi:hypothetical protein
LLFFEADPVAFGRPLNGGFVGEFSDVDGLDWLTEDGGRVSPEKESFELIGSLFHVDWYI